MGRSTTPTYVVHLTVPGFHYTPAAWRVKQAGRPTDANLAAYVKAFEASTEPGGVNAHLGPQTVRSAQVVRQATGEQVASYAAPRKVQLFLATPMQQGIR